MREALSDLPPEGTNIGDAARRVADVFGCPIEEAHKVLDGGIAARIAEQNAARVSSRGSIDDAPRE